MSIAFEVRQRLLDLPTPFALVRGAGTLAQVKDRPTALPSAFVFVKEEASAENERMSGGHLQITEMDIAVVLVTENLADENGAEGSDDIETLKAFVRSRLVGWKAPSAETQISHVSGQMVQAKAGTVWFEDVFSTNTMLEA